jgi:hypothetical protein
VLQIVADKTATTAETRMELQVGKCEFLPPMVRASRTISVEVVAEGAIGVPLNVMLVEGAHPRSMGAYNRGPKVVNSDADGRLGQIGLVAGFGSASRA